LPANEKLLLSHGTLRRCGDCLFKTLERTEMRLHERRSGHNQDKSMQDKVKKYTPEEQVARQKYGKKAVKAMGV